MSKWYSMFAMISALKELLIFIFCSLLWLVLIVDQGSFFTIVAIGKG